MKKLGYCGNVIFYLWDSGGFCKINQKSRGLRGLGHE